MFTVNGQLLRGGLCVQSSQTTDEEQICILRNEYLFFNTIYIIVNALVAEVINVQLLLNL